MKPISNKNGAALISAPSLSAPLTHFFQASIDVFDNSSKTLGPMSLEKLCYEVLEANFETVPVETIARMPTTILQAFIAYSMRQRKLGSYAMTVDNVYKLFTPNLTSLDLQNFWLTDAPFVSHLRSPHLAEIDLRRCQQLGDGTLETLATHCTALTSLRATSCQRIYDAGVGALTRLRELKVLGLNLHGVGAEPFGSVVKTCTNIQHLHLECPWSLTAESFRGLADALPFLQVLKIEDVKLDDGKFLKSAWSEQNFSHLRTLKLKKAPRLTILELPPFQKLSKLTLDNIEAKVLAGMPELKSLTSLSIVRCRFSPLGLQLSPIAGQLHSLSLVECKRAATVDIAQIVASLSPALRRLQFYRVTTLDDSALLALPNLPDIDEVVLAWSGLRHQFICGRAIHRLSLEGTQQLTDLTLQSIITLCPNVAWFSLRECQLLTDQVLKMLKDQPGLQQLRYLDLSKCLRLRKPHIALPLLEHLDFQDQTACVPTIECPSLLRLDASGCFDTTPFVQAIRFTSATIGFVWFQRAQSELKSLFQAVCDCPQIEAITVTESASVIRVEWLAKVVQARKRTLRRLYMNNCIVDSLQALDKLKDSHPRLSLSRRHAKEQALPPDPVVEPQ